MEVRARIIQALTRWTNSFPGPKEESSLFSEVIPLLQAELPEVGITGEVESLARSIVLAENAEKIKDEINRACAAVVQRYQEGPQLDSLRSADIAQCLAAVTAMGDECLLAAEEAAGRYAQRGSETWKLLRLKKVKKRAEAFLLQQLKLKEVQAVQGLAGNITAFFVEFTTAVTRRLQAIRDDKAVVAPRLSALFQELYAAHKAAFLSIPHLPSAYLSRADNEFKAAFLGAVRFDLEPFVTVLIRQVCAGTLKVFDNAICSKGTKDLVRSVALAVIPERGFEELRTQLLAALEVQEPQGAECESVPLGLQEKYAAILSLVLFFSKADGDCHYKPHHRSLNRQIVLKLFGDEGARYPMNDWFLARSCEDCISSILSDLGRNPYRQPSDDMKSRANEHFQFCSAIKLFNPVPLTPAQFPALHLTIVIPGWLSEKEELVAYWNSIAKYSYYGAVVGLQWEAGSTASVAVSGAKDLILTAGSFLIPVGGCFIGPAMVANLWNANPFADSAERAQETGRFLAYYIKHRAFGDVAVSLIGFSLGGRMVAAVLTELADDEEVYIQDAIMIGGAVSYNTEKWQKRRKAVAGRLINVMSKNDDVLAKIYTTAKLEKAIGSHPIEVEGIENYDASEYVAGHSDHPQKLDQTLTNLNVSP